MKRIFSNTCQHGSGLSRMQMLLFAALTLLSSGTACAGGNSEQISKSGDDSAMDSMVVRRNSQIELDLHVQFPKENSALRERIMETLSEWWGGTYTGSYSDPKKMIQFYADSALHQMQVDSTELAKIGIDLPGFSRYLDLKRVYEDATIVTYQLHWYSYEGGAHGLGGTIGYTFRKSDGRMFDWEMLRNYYDPAQGGDPVQLSDVVKELLKKELNVKTDEDLKGMLLLDKDSYYSFPLPENKPYIVDNKVVLVYAPYEIGPYALGSIQVEIPADQIRPFLKVTGLRMLN